MKFVLERPVTLKEQISFIINELEVETDMRNLDALEHNANLNAVLASLQELKKLKGGKR